MQGSGKRRRGEKGDNYKEVFLDRKKWTERETRENRKAGKMGGACRKEVGL